MVIFFLIKRTVWDRYLQVVIVKLDAINAAPTKVGSFYRRGAEEARGAHNPEDIRSKRIAGIFHFSHFIEIRMSRLRDKTLLFYRHGAGAARRAHNPEVTRSKRVVGIFPKSYKHMLFTLFNIDRMNDGEYHRVEQMKAVQAGALELFTRKNADYGDAFAKYGVIGVLMRIEDKLQRSMSITKNGVNLVNDEGIRDTLIDLHNYAAMAVMLLDE